MKLAIIVAMDINGVIGRNNKLPWTIPEDLAYFRAKTLGHNVIMGKNTWLSLGKPLDQRTNIILSRSEDFHPAGGIVCRSIPQALEYVKEELTFIIGGAQIFGSFLPLVDQLFITQIASSFAGDTYFPTLDYSAWNLQFYEQLQTASGLTISFNEYSLAVQ